MRVLTIDELRSLKGIPYSRSQIWRKIRDGSFVRPIRLGGNRTGWLEHEVDQWLQERIAERDGVKLETTDQREASNQ